MSGQTFVFSDKKGTQYKDEIYIGENGDFKTLESYLRIEKEEYIYDFTKNHLNKSYFSEEDCFISLVHKNPLDLRLKEPLIPRKSLVIARKKLNLNDALKNKDSFRDQDYDIFSGDMIDETIEYKRFINENIKFLQEVLYNFLEAGYLELENNKKIEDWIVTFQEPILDLLIRYHRLETSAPDISTPNEFLINPEFRKTICIMIMKIISNFLVNNKMIKSKTLKNYSSWQDKDLWFSLRDI